MAEKKIEVINLQEKLKKAEQNVVETMKRHRQEKKMFDKLIGNREKEEKLMRQQIIATFRMNWAAKKIQAYWRKWRKAMSRRRRRSAFKKPKK